MDKKPEPFRINFDEEPINYCTYDTSDPFVVNPPSPHIMFAGCSVTFGEAMEHNMDKNWSRIVLDRLSKLHGAELPYFNTAVSGASIGEIVDQCFKYSRKYGTPDVIFMLLPNIHRDVEYLGTEPMDTFHDRIDMFAYRMYLYLDEYCRTNNIQLYGFTWAEDITDNPELLPLERTNPDRPHWGEQIHDIASASHLLKSFDSYYTFDVEDEKLSVFKYHEKNKKTDPNTLVLDDNIHPGHGFHQFWADFIWDKYLKRNNINS